MKQKHEDGEYLFLFWDGDPEAYYVRGHIDFQRAREIVASVEGFPTSCLGECFHKYGIWSLAGESEKTLGIDLVLRVKDDRGRGRFRITECRPAV